MVTLAPRRSHLLIALIASLLLAGLSALLAPSAFACSCVVPPPPGEALEQSVEVFTGKVIEVTRSDESVEGRFQVTQAWKGVDQQEITISTPLDSAACGIDFVEGTEYLVYTFEAGETNLCSRTTAMETADEDLEALGPGTPGSELGSNEADGDDEDETSLWILGGLLGLVVIGAASVLVVRRSNGKGQPTTLE